MVSCEGHSRIRRHFQTRVKSRPSSRWLIHQCAAVSHHPKGTQGMIHVWSISALVAYLQPRPCIVSPDPKREPLQAAETRVRPSAMREVALEVPNIGWDDVGGLDHIKQSLKAHLPHHPPPLSTLKPKTCLWCSRFRKGIDDCAGRAPDGLCRQLASFAVLVGRV